MYHICILICIPYASLCVSYMYPICILYAAYVYPICILYASLYVSYLYPICILYVSHMYPICILICNEYAFHMYSVRHTTACHERSSLGVKRYEITSSRCDGKQQSIAENRSYVEANLQQGEAHRRPMCKALRPYVVSQQCRSLFGHKNQKPTQHLSFDRLRITITT